MEPPLNVTLDIGPAVHQNAGLARYAERLAAHLLRDHAADLDLTLFYNAHGNHQPPPTLADAPTRTVNLGQLPWRLSALASQLARQPLHERWIFPAAQSTHSALRTPHSAPPLFHATEHLLPHLRQPTILTVHDLIFEHYPEHHTRRNHLFLRAAVPRFARAADALIAVSHHTKRDLVELYRLPPQKIHVIHEGIDASFAPASAGDVARVRRAHGIDGPYLLMVGTLEPRKGHATALRALARLRTASANLAEFEHKLLIVGGEGWLFEPVRALVNELRLGDRVQFTGYVPQPDLAPLYTGAAGVLVPSLYEGFGFSVLEAMACAAPVICSDVSSLPEVAGGAALLVPPGEDEALAAAIRQLLDEPTSVADLRERGQRQAARFRWSTTARETVALYREVAARRRFEVVQRRERGTVKPHPRSG